MPWSAPTFTGGVVWEDTPSAATPLDAAELNLEENAEAFYAAMVGASVVAYLEGGAELLGLKNIGNVTTTATLDMAGLIARSFTFVLTADPCQIVVINAVPGSRVDVIPFQDGNPPRTIRHPTVTAWTSTGPPTLSNNANAPDRFEYLVMSVDGSGNPTSIVGSLGFTSGIGPGPISPPIVTAVT